MSTTTNAPDDQLEAPEPTESTSRTKGASFAHKLYTGQIGYDFIGNRKRWYIVSAVLLAISILALSILRLNLGIEFKGGADFTETVLAGLRAGVAVVDRDLRVVAWNNEAADLWGIREDEAVGAPLAGLDIGLPLEPLAPIRPFAPFGPDPGPGPLSQEDLAAIERMIIESDDPKL